MRLTLLERRGELLSKDARESGRPEGRVLGWTVTDEDPHPRAFDADLEARDEGEEADAVGLAAERPLEVGFWSHAAIMRARAETRKSEQCPSSEVGHSWSQSLRARLPFRAFATHH